MQAPKLLRLIAAGVLFAAAPAVAQSLQTQSARTQPAENQLAQNESADQNVRQSEQYESLLCTNAAFRAKRIATECGPVTDQQLHDSCVASFRCKQGATAPHWRHAPPSETTR